MKGRGRRLQLSFSGLCKNMQKLVLDDTYDRTISRDTLYVKFALLPHVCSDGSPHVYHFDKSEYEIDSAGNVELILTMETQCSCDRWGFFQLRDPLRQQQPFSRAVPLYVGPVRYPAANSRLKTPRPVPESQPPYSPSDFEYPPVWALTIRGMALRCYFGSLVQEGPANRMRRTRGGGRRRGLLFFFNC